MLKHLNLRSIAEIVLKVISIDPFKEIEKKEAILEKRDKLINSLFEIAIIREKSNASYEVQPTNFLILRYSITLHTSSQKSLTTTKPSSTDKN
jgi:hypothetical protein